MFILNLDWCTGPDPDIDDEIEPMMDAHRRYFAYVDANRDQFPASAYELAAAQWRHDFNDHRALHDSWVESFRFFDESLPEGGPGRSNSLELTVLGAYHDGKIRLIYRNVDSAQLHLSEASTGPIQIYRDEIRLSGGGHVLHEIEFLGQENWLIECNDMTQHWEPLGTD